MSVKTVKQRKIKKFVKFLDEVLTKKGKYLTFNYVVRNVVRTVYCTVAHDFYVSKFTRNIPNINKI
jgi:hypothetical protein